MADTRPLKRYCLALGEYGVNVPSDRYRTQGVRLIRTSDVTEEGVLRPDEEAVFIDEAYAEGLLLEPGDLLFSRSGSLGRGLLYPGFDTPATFAGYLVRFRARADVDARFLYYASRSASFQQQIEADAIQSTIGNFNAEKYGNLRIPEVAPDEQREIADFLDAETARIDALIEKKQRMIALLRERFQAAIDRALGDEAFPRVRSHVVCRFVRGLSTSQLELNNEGLGVRYLRTSDLIEDLPFAKFDERFCETPPSEAVWKRDGELALTIEGFVRPDGRSTIGVACWRGEGLLNNHAVLVHPRDDRVDPRFAQYAHASSQVAGVLRASAVGAIALSAGGALRELSMPLPPIEVQRQIAATLDAEKSRLDRVTETERRMIDLLRERRQALITAAVTGQLDVSRATA